MSINRVQFQKGLSMAEFLERYGTEDQCHSALVALRWPEGFVCPDCGCAQHCSFVREERRYWQCRACRTQFTVTCGTVFEATKLPLTRWFVAMHLDDTIQKQRLGAGIQAPSRGALQGRPADQAYAAAGHDRA